MVSIPNYPGSANRGVLCFRTASESDEVYVTGTFDKWQKTNKLSKSSSGVLEKEIHLPLNEKVSYKVKKKHAHTWG
jgi:hypothetical protein